VLGETGLNPEQVAYVGDDLPDLPVMQRVGFSIAVHNANEFVHEHCHWVTSQSGGKGAVREVTDFILKSQSLLEARSREYLK